MARAIAEQVDAIENLIDAMTAAGAIHCYGFGRSGHAAASLAIRLRHFQRLLPPVWWVGDVARNPFAQGDIFISFSRKGTRFELVELVRHAHERGLTCVFVTRALGTDTPAGGLARPEDIVIELPSLDQALLSPATIYGGDFELAAYLFQEVLVARIGFRCAVPPFGRGPVSRPLTESNRGSRPVSARLCFVFLRDPPIGNVGAELATTPPENLFVQALTQLCRLSTIAPPGEGICDLRFPVIVIDADERPVSISPGLRTALGLRPDAPPPGSLRAIMDEASAWRVHAALRYGGTSPHDSLALRLVAPDGGSRIAAAEFLPTTEGGAVLVVSLAPDPWSGSDAAHLLDNSQDLVFSIWLRPTLAFRYVNAASAAVTGYSPDEIRADPAGFIEAIHPDDRDLVADAFADAGRPQSPVIFRFRHRNGEWRWFELFATPVLDPADRVAAVDGIARDVTVRHRLEEQFRLLAERSPEMIYRIRLDPDCATDYVSPACEAVTGRLPGEFYGDPWLLLRYVHPDDRPMLAECTEQPANFCVRPLLFRIFHPDGSVHWIEQVNVPVCDEMDRLVAIEGVCRDVTERQEVEATLQGMNRRMNLLAALTRHDILNQLTVLLGSLELAGTAESTTELAWFLGRSREAAWAIQRLTEFTRDYQEIGQGLPGWVSVTALIRRATDSFAGNGVTIGVPDEEWEIRADPLIEQVFYNLIENALRHGKSVGRVQFSIEGRPLGGASIVCEDDGAGVPVNEKERIFERGYGRNTGLGLYLSREILAITGMTIVEVGRPGSGARFEILVPPGACRTSSSRQAGLSPHRG